MLKHILTSRLGKFIFRHVEAYLLRWANCVTIVNHVCLFVQLAYQIPTCRLAGFLSYIAPFFADTSTKAENILGHPSQRVLHLSRGKRFFSQHDIHYPHMMGRERKSDCECRGEVCGRSYLSSSRCPARSLSGVAQCINARLRKVKFVLQITGISEWDGKVKLLPNPRQNLNRCRI